MGTADYSSAQSILLALMNSAPAELLHPLIDAALQPSLAQSLSQHLSAALQGQKTPAVTPASEFYCRDTLFFPKKTPPNPIESG